jgi:hypothetical protein
MFECGKELVFVMQLLSFNYSVLHVNFPGVKVLKMDIINDLQRSILHVIDNSEPKKFVYQSINGNPLHESVLLDVAVVTVKRAVPKFKKKRKLLKRVKFIKVLLLSLVKLKDESSPSNRWYWNFVVVPPGLSNFASC